MKCPNCGNMWEDKEFLSSNTYVCPFCGKPLDGSNHCDDENIRTVFKKIISTYGMDLLSDNRRIKALLMDYAPKLNRERKLLLLALEEGVAYELMKIKEGTSDEVKICLARCQRQLVSDMWITEQAAQYAVQSIAYAMDIGVVETCSERNNEGVHSENFRELCKGISHSDEESLNTLLLGFESIGYKACAANTNMKNVVVPKQIRIIKTKAFYKCINLVHITILGKIESLGYGVFEGCNNLREIDIRETSNYMVSNGMLIDKRNKYLLRAVNDEAVARTIPTGVEVIDSRAFENNPFCELFISKTVTDIKVNAISGCLQLEKITVDLSNQTFFSEDGILYNKNQTIMLLYPPGKKGISSIVEESVEMIGDGAFSHCKFLETITYTSNLKHIGKRAFQYCRKIETLLFPSSVETIGERAFQYCKSLKSVMLSRSIMEIGDYAFYECIMIETINIPKSVKRIGHMAFANCVSLKRVVMQENIEFIGDAAFIGCAPDLELCMKDNEYARTYCISHEIKYSLM